jgi:hypothetical protein
MAQRSLRRTELIGTSISAPAESLDDLPCLADQCAGLDGQPLDDELKTLEWALGMSVDRLLGVLAILVARSINLTHEDCTGSDLRKQAVADRLSQQLDIDMTKFWAPELDFWLRLPKAVLLELLADAPDTAQRSERARADLAKAHAKLRKDELAARVASAYPGAGYLPDVLVTPVPTGALHVTGEGMAAIAAPLVAAE